MGIFHTIKKRINNATTLIKNSRNLNEKFIPYFNMKEKYSTLEKIDSTIDSNITKIYYELKINNPIKYSNAIKRYDDFIVKVEKHNKLVEEIDLKVDTFNFSEIINNPYKYEKTYIESLLIAAEKIKNFSNYKEKYGIFCNRVIEIKVNFDLIKEQFDSIKTYNELFVFEDKYIDSIQKEILLEKIKPLQINIKKAGKEYYDFSKLNKVDTIINTHNRDYIEKNKKDVLFDNINGKSLDNEQREAIIKDEKSNLIIAGAGCGKTLTICGKVKYLLERLNYKPEDILLLSYSKKSAEDLASKVETIDSRLTVGTFHKLGLDILNETKGKVSDIEEQFNAIIETYFRDEIVKKPNMMQKVLNYFAYYMSSNSINKKYKDEGELFDELKKNDFQTLKNLTENIDKKETIKKELVKSYEELVIANFYFINGIKYVYEMPYEIDVSNNEKRQYKPDFYLPDFKIYHEHYGINKEGNASQFVNELDSKKYVEIMEWKKRIHFINKTLCIETYSYEFNDDTIFEKLTKILTNNGVKFEPLTDSEIYNALHSIYQGKNFKSFLNLVRTFLSLYKSKYVDEKQFDSFKKANFSNVFERRKASLFLDIVKDVYLFYLNNIRSKNRIDFDDMILQSIDALKETKNFSYKYIIVDEFQDISYSRMLFLKGLINHGNSKLFAVGDDWQAIYRFSGCDLNIFIDFEKYFGCTEISYITTTHRNSQELQNIGGPFIKRNQYQFDKTIKSDKRLTNPVKIMFYNDDKYQGLLKIFENIRKINENANVLILGRNNKDIEDFYTSRLYKEVNTQLKGVNRLVSKDFPKFSLRYSTVHASKGLEDEFVIIINADDGKLGFPNKIEDDELLDLVLSNKNDYEYAEERRLWYVALTRTKTYTYILTNRDYPSVFVKEIIDECEIINREGTKFDDSFVKCPYCKSGKLLLRQNETTKKKFYGCSNFPYCQYTIDDFRAVKRNLRCQRCGDFMIYRKGPYGSFYGCNNYPKCDYVREYSK